MERLRPAQIPLDSRRGGEHVQWASGAFHLAPFSRDRQGLLAPPSDFGRVPPTKGEASETRRRADDETDVVLLLRNGLTLLERLSSRVVVEISASEDPGAEEGPRAGEGSRVRPG